MTRGSEPDKSTLADRGVSLRPIAPGDEPFLLQVYSLTRQEELAFVDWNDQQKAAFLKMQFEAQHQYYQEVYRGADFQVIVVDGVAAGRLYVARWEDELRLIDIALLPEYRGSGLGTMLVRQIMEEAAQSNKAVRIHVEKFNKALRLYERLGFKAIQDKGVYWFMEWRRVLEAEV